jgi:regulator of sigma E protease
MEWLSSLGLVGEIIRGIIVVFEALLVLNLLILVHEWGHFLAARWRGLKVEKFYIWFGKALWKRTYNGVEYGLGSIPLGGFVQLPQMGPMGGVEGQEESEEQLAPITPLDKIIVAFAGPLFSFLLAVLFACVVSVAGQPDRRIHVTTVGFIDPKEAGASAGFQLGDKILSIDGVAVTSWDEPINSVKERIAFSRGEKIVFEVQRPGVPEPVVLTSGFTVDEGDAYNRRGLRRVGLLWEADAFVDAVLKNSGADLAGLKPDDKITQLNGAKVYSPLGVTEHFKTATGPTKLTIERAGQSMEVTLNIIQPTAPKEIPAFANGLANSGMAVSMGNAAERALLYPSPLAQIKMASTMVFRTFGAIWAKLTRKQGDIGLQQMGSPIKIIDTYVSFLKIPDGWRWVLWFSVILNVNLAIMNLIPLPVFDGGHIVMAVGEMMRRGPVLPLRIMEIVQGTCVAMLLSFFLYVGWYDVAGLMKWGAKEDAAFRIDQLQYPIVKP